MNKFILLLLFLNFADYFLTINNLGHFEETNIIMAQFLAKPFALILIKLIFIPFLLIMIFIYFKKNKPKLIHYILIVTTLLFYIYAVVLGALIAIR